VEVQFLFILALPVQSILRIIEHGELGPRQEPLWMLGVVVSWWLRALFGTLRSCELPVCRPSPDCWGYEHSEPACVSCATGSVGFDSEKRVGALGGVSCGVWEGKR
jgi:hypothetical protein